jgi:hypothetical protein
MERSNTGAIVVGVGLALGIALDVLTFIVGRYGPSGGSDTAAWSFRGNGALIVPFGLGPAILAGGWTAVVLHGRKGVPWLRWGLIVFAVGAALVLVSVLLTVSGNLSAASALTLATLAWPLVAPIATVLLHRAPQANTTRHAVAQAAFTISALAGFALAGQLLPPGS